MNKTADICVIGGGISGVAIGYFLLKNGAKNVLLLERGHLAYGATGRCGAGIRQQWGTELNCVISKYSLDFFETAQDELQYNGDIEFHQTGYMLLISNERELEQMKKNVALQNSLGIDSQLLTCEDARQIVPILNTDNLLGTAFCQKDGHLNPFHMTQAFADAFKRLGGEIMTYTDVTGITAANGRVTGITTNKGFIAAETVVNAAGGWAQEIAGIAGLDLPLFSERHNIMVTEPVEPILGPMIMSFSLNLYCQQTPHGSFLMGRTDDAQPRDLRMTSYSGFPELIAQSVVNVMPALKNLRVLRQWAGLYNVSPDNAAIYSAASDPKGFYTAAGFSGHGFMTSPATGQSMAEMILGLPPTLPWQRMDVSRFDSGELLLEPSVV
ncbi:MAG: FAD-binding oxidoreductase [Defluviitaleaceae bacterium]|nr:FAD-binding oxidoreductase [Defluviitaleaceae bacterium]